MQAAIEISLDYFYGAYLDDPRWAEQMAKVPENEGLPWVEVFRNGLLFCLLSEDEQSLQRLATWIDPDLPFDETSFLLSLQDNSYYKLLAFYLSNQASVDQDLTAMIENSRKRRPKLLLSCLQAIETDDKQAVVLRLQQFLDYFLKTELDSSGFRTFFSIEGTILWHVAKQNGMNISELSDKQMALIITRESLEIE